MESVVLSFTFSLDQLRHAPPEVRHWVEHELAASLRGLAEPQQEPPIGHSAELAACSADEALQILQLISSDLVATQVYLQLAREAPIGDVAPPLHAFSFDQMKRQLRLTDEGFAGSLQRINQAFQEIRKNPDAMLFGFDQARHLYVHEMTYHSIRSVWEQLIQVKHSEGSKAPLGADRVQLPPAYCGTERKPGRPLPAVKRSGYGRNPCWERPRGRHRVPE